MATVSMSQTLRDQIAENFKQQLFKAYRVHSDIEPHIQKIVNHIRYQDDDFRSAVDLQDEWSSIYKTLAIKFPNAASGSSYSDILTENFIKPQRTLGLIINPSLPKESNFTFYSEYSQYYKEMEDGGYGVKEYRQGLLNYNNGDVPVVIKDLEPFYAPFDFDLRYHRGWGETQYSPNGASMLITDPDMCNALSKIGEVEKKVSDKLVEFMDYLLKITTLKKFVDEWPGAMSLVPEEYKQRMVKKTIKSTVQRLTPEQIIPDELKQEMNEVILTNKLTGED